MKKFIALAASALALFLFPASPALSENSSDPIVMYRLSDGGIREVSDHFSPGGKIYADFTFLPDEKEMGVEFRWINPQNNKEQAYFELVKTPIPPKKKTLLCWLLLQPSLPEKIIGSRFFGRWRLEIWVNSRRVAEKAFDVGT
jgi:hypothetical protein